LDRAIGAEAATTGADAMVACSGTDAITGGADAAIALSEAVC